MEYWIVDLATRRIEVYRRPAAFGYEQQHIATAADELLTFEAFPTDAFTLEALLGPSPAD
jgi:Uma2 family endonuclease